MGTGSGLKKKDRIQKRFLGSNQTRFFTVSGSDTVFPLFRIIGFLIIESESSLNTKIQNPTLYQAFDQCIVLVIYLNSSEFFLAFLKIKS